MNDILMKEMKLSASPLAYLFIAFGLMFLLPGYPILCGAFFVTLGIFQSFQYAREANDILFSALLPVAKSDVVKGKYMFSCFIELCGLAVMAISAIARTAWLSEFSVYKENVLMNANIFALGAALLIFGVFNLIFVGGFFRTSYKLAWPFVIYMIAAFIIIAAAEVLHHLPGLGGLDAIGTAHLPLRLCLLALNAGVYIILTAASYRHSCVLFENTDL